MLRPRLASRISLGLCLTMHLLTSLSQSFLIRETRLLSFLIHSRSLVMLPTLTVFEMSLGIAELSSMWPNTLSSPSPCPISSSSALTSGSALSSSFFTLVEAIMDGMGCHFFIVIALCDLPAYSRGLSKSTLKETNLLLRVSWFPCGAHRYRRNGEGYTTSVVVNTRW